MYVMYNSASPSLVLGQAEVVAPCLQLGKATESWLSGEMGQMSSGLLTALLIVIGMFL